MDYKKRIARLLVENNIIKFNVNSPFTYTSGLIGPVYTNCRDIISLVDVRKEVVKGMKSLVKNNVKSFDGFSGTASAGIPWAAYMAEQFDKKMIYVRDKPHGHGMRKQIEGRYARGERFIVTEDHITTGGSLIKEVDVLRGEGITVEDGISITTYNLAESVRNFADKGVRFNSLTDIQTAIDISVDEGKLLQTDKTAILEWLQDPRGWSIRRGVAEKPQT